MKFSEIALIALTLIGSGGVLAAAGDSLGGVEQLVKHAGSNIWVPNILLGLLTALGFYSIRNDFKSLKTDVASLKTDVTSLKTDVVSIKETLNEEFCSIGVKVARNTTVILKHSETPMGQGLICHINGRNYLVTAAHVLLGLEGLDSLSVWTAGIHSRKLFDITKVHAIFLHPRYLQQGEHDFGFLDFSLQEANNGPWSQRNLKTVDIFNFRIPDRRMLVGHHASYLNPGRLLDRTGLSRVLVSMQSKPGCSGSPLFDSSGNLVSCVHGDSKHRVKMIAASDNTLSAFAVYADTLAWPNVGDIDAPILRRVNMEHFDNLRSLEDLDASALTEVDTKIKVDATWQRVRSLLPRDNEHDLQAFCDLARRLGLIGEVTTNTVLDRLSDVALGTESIAIPTQLSVYWIGGEGMD